LFLKVFSLKLAPFLSTDFYYCRDWRFISRNKT
jgi:hypothetical protein